jgi:S-adenosylmethionine hydrolase
MTSRAPRHPPTVALLTDFGYRDHYAGVMRGVIASIAPAARVLDLTHGIPAQWISAGALVLRESWRFFPARTIFVAVVDPGVGTERKPLVIETRAGTRFVGPDNGLLWPAADQAGIERVVELRTPRYRLMRVSASFHGRDIFAPAAAWLARGVDPDAMGPAVSTIVRLDLAEGVSSNQRRLAGRVIYIDAFGNLVTNITRQDYDKFAGRFRGCDLLVRIKGRAPLRLRSTYGDARVGAPLAMFGSFDMLEIAIRDGNAAEFYGVDGETPVMVTAARREK